jgi:hypothetical protein
VVRVDKGKDTLSDVGNSITPKAMADIYRVRYGNKTAKMIIERMIEKMKQGSLGFIYWTKVKEIL